MINNSELKDLRPNTIAILFYFSLLAKVCLGQGLVINEVMSDNESYVKDNDGEYTDWIEFYNNGVEPISINDYFISDKGEDLEKWKLPNLILDPGEFLVIFASDKDYFDGMHWHSNFKISAEGETIYLSTSNTIQDEVKVPALDEDKTYGRVPDGGNIFGVLDEPSFEAKNQETNVLKISHESGIYEESQNVFIEEALGHDIRYSINGDFPTLNSPLFSQGMTLDYIEDQENYFCNYPTTTSADLILNPAWIRPQESVVKVHVLRFATFDGDIQTSDVFTRTIIISKGTSHDYSLPIISLVAEEKDLFSDSIGLLVPGDFYDEENPEWTGNFFESGEEWERPAHFTYFSKKRNIKVDQEIGIRVHGGKTRSGAQKSLRLYAREEYGKKTMDYNFLPRRDHDEYKRLVLRTVMGAWGNAEVPFLDEFAQYSVRNMKITTLDSRPVVVFINGEYWGIYSIRDRIDNDYIAYANGLDEDSVEISTGANNHFREMRDFIKWNDLSIDENYEFVKERLDLSAFIDYNLAQMYLRNYDWPGNNNGWWREKKEGGKWRNYMYDLDAAFDDYEYDMVAHNSADDPDIGWPNNQESTLFFRRLIEHPEFIDSLLSRFIYVQEHVFHPDTMLQDLNEFRAIYNPEMEEHIERWSHPNSLFAMNNAIEERLVDFINNRPCEFKKHLELKFNIELSYDCITQSTPIAAEDVEVVIFPNPARDFIRVETSNVNCELCEVTIYNTMGQSVMRNSRLRFTDNKSELDLTSIGLQNGLYLFTIRDVDGQLHTREFLFKI